MAHRKANVLDGVLLSDNSLILSTYCVLLLSSVFSVSHLYKLNFTFPALSFRSLPGLKAGDEILLLNGKPASALQMDDMRAAFVNHTLTLSVSTLPQLDPLVLCSLPPRRSDGEQDPATDIFSQSQGKASCSR